MPYRKSFNATFICIFVEISKQIGTHLSDVAEPNDYSALQ